MTARVPATMQGAMSYRKTTDGIHIAKVAIVAAGVLVAPDGSPVQPVAVVAAGATLNGRPPIAGSTTIAEGGPTLYVDVLAGTPVLSPSGRAVLGILDPDATIGGGGVPANALTDDAGNPLLDDAGNYILNG